MAFRCDGSRLGGRLTDGTGEKFDLRNTRFLLARACTRHREQRVVAPQSR